MARLKIDLPAHFAYETALPVRVSDVNYGGHVGNDKILALMQEARTLFFRELGFNSEARLEGNVGEIMTDAAVVYKSESFLGDVLIIQVAVAELTRYGYTVYYRVFNKATGKDVAHGRTAMACFDYVKRKLATVPETLRVKLG